MEKPRPGWSLSVLVVTVLLLSSSKGSDVNSTRVEGGFLEEVCRVTRMVMAKCWHKAVEGQGDGEVLAAVKGCLQSAGLVALERMSQVDIIQLPFGAKLVRTSPFNLNETLNRWSSGEGWRSQALEKAARILRTHALQLPVRDIVEGRRRHKQQEMSVILFGIMAMVVIAIPLGFQFLAVLGGKALLLAKMALILSSIQGLKKIATSDVNYGLYSAGHGRPWQYDRKSQHPPYDLHGPEGYDIPDREIDAFFPLKPRRSIFGY